MSRASLRPLPAICITALFLVPGLPACAAEDCANPGGFHREVAWQTAEGKPSGRGLYLFECAPSGLNSRLLIETAAGNKIVLTDTLDARRGLERVKLQDDASGWWMTSEHDLHFRSRDLGDFFAKAYDRLEPLPGRTTAYRLRTSTGFAFATEVPILGHAETDWGQILDQVRAAGLGEKLAAQAPEGLVEAVRFLRALPEPAPYVESTGSTMSYPTILLEGIVGRPSAQRESWKEVPGTLRKGLVVTDPELLGFVSRFKTVSNAEPLADHRLADVVPPVESPAVQP